MFNSRYDSVDKQWGPLDASPIHFIGVGGAGMSVIASMFAAHGAEVSGSDSKESSVTKQLSDSGILVQVPQAASNITSPKTVVLSSAIRDDNPELLQARESGAKIIHRSQALALLMRGQRAVAVAGAHGKTTTSAMIAVAAAASGLEPSFAIGGSVRTETGSIPGGMVGSSDLLVAEADESDGSFLNYEPFVAVVTNIEPDHLDHYGSKEAFEAAFVEFASKVSPQGLVVACNDDPGASAFAQTLKSANRAVLTYGQAAASDLLITNVVQESGDSGITFELAWKELPEYSISAGSAKISLKSPGLHNALNASAAFAALLFLGCAPADISSGLELFVGTGRRFEPKGIVNGIQVVDDYAHHPTEVLALLKAARLAAGSGKVLALFQPHLFSRTRIFSQEFAAALDLADSTVLTAIYAAREDLDPETTSENIARYMSSPVSYVEDKFEAAQYVANQARPGDLVLTIGAGDVTELGPKILSVLQEKLEQ